MSRILVSRSLFLLPLFLLSSLAVAAPTLKQIMQDPDWIGPPVEAVWWQLDGSGYHYRVKRPGSQVRDVYAMAELGGEAAAVSAAQLAVADGENVVLHHRAQLAASVVGPRLQLRDLQTGVSRPLFVGRDAISEVRFSADADEVYFWTHGGWWSVPSAGGAPRALTDLRFTSPPDDPESPDVLEREQLRLFTTLDRERQWRSDAQQQALDFAAVESTAPAPWYLGDDKQRVFGELSPDGRWLLLVVRAKGAAPGRQDKMPSYVTPSGYVEVEDVRRLVGRDAPTPHALWLLDLQQRQRYEISLAGLSGLTEDPLRELKVAQGMAANGADDPRSLRISRVIWHPEGEQALVQVRALDNKDRWTLRLNAANQTWDEVHRLTDPAWINWQFNELGWIPGSRDIWLLSEESGYSHLYTIDARGTVQRTRGEFEVSGVEFSSDGRSALMVTNREHPTQYDLYELLLADNQLERLTDLKGVEGFVLHPDGTRVLLRYSGPYQPAQAGILDLANRQLSAVTNTLEPEYAAIDWQLPEYVAVPSKHGARQPIWSKFYPARAADDEPRPVVIFVHGAGYTQNTHHKFPYYFREQMFHNLLAAAGFHVLDMDYRASRGYGRDWRTAIYRQMGGPELEDLVDGVQWLVDEHNADPNRVGIYGGSYGGFMTFMAMFKAPDVFAAGAALRPVTDWRHYNHGYTANILNSPLIDPEAHRRSSPIEFVEGLRGSLLISHGMLDDNVFYKDSVRLVQRLIELEKTDWELASYPLEPHGFVHPESWLDQYRRILSLFQRSLASKVRTDTGF